MIKSCVTNLLLKTRTFKEISNNFTVKTKFTTSQICFKNLATFAVKFD